MVIINHYSVYYCGGTFECVLDRNNNWPKVEVEPTYIFI